VICFDVLGTRKCQNFKFLTKSRFTTNRTCYTLLNFRKNPTGGVSIEMAEPIPTFCFIWLAARSFDLSPQNSKFDITAKLQSSYLDAAQL
jgi:hypothetical protein